MSAHPLPMQLTIQSVMSTSVQQLAEVLTEWLRYFSCCVYMYISKQKVSSYFNLMANFFEGSGQVRAI